MSCRVMVMCGVGVVVVSVSVSCGVVWCGGVNGEEQGTGSGQGGG